MKYSEGKAVREMTGRMKLYIGLLVLALVFMGTGLWFLFNPLYVIDIPEGEPIITMYNSYRTIGQGPDHLYIYQDGEVIFVEQKGIVEDATRIWSTGKLQKVEVDELLDFVKHSGFASLNGTYQFPGELVDGATKTGGMSCTISINYKDLNKTVNADWYLSPDGGIMYPDMPYPLNEIYEKLKQIIDNKTEEVYEESIKD